jgi:hypothetical protein
MSSKCPENFIGIRTRGPRGTALSEQQRLALIDWTKSSGEKAVANEFGVTAKTIFRWKTGAPVTHGLYKKVCDALHGRFTANDPGDPADYIRRLFEEGRRLHYGCFLPEAAMDVLQRVEFHPSLHVVPPADALNMLALTMSIYRQSIDATEGHFHSCGRICLNLLSKISLQDYGEELAASICTAAWELIAATVQRGWAMQGIPLLERVNRTLDERKLWPHLQIGRERSIRRLMHWGRVVAYERFDDVDSYIRKHGSPIDEFDPKLIRSPVEIHNIALQKMSELLRFSMVEKAKYDDRALGYFEATIRPVLVDLAKSARDFSSPANQARSIADSFTPSTVVAMAFESFLVALHLQPRDASEITEYATHVAKQIHRASDSAIMLQTMNPETQKLIKSRKAAGILPPEITAMFAFVSDISQRGKIKLHAMALQLLDRVPGCARQS